MKIITLYDGTLQAKTSLRYGINKVKEKGGEVVVLHTFQNSLFVDYGAGPRAEEMAREEAVRHLREAEKIISEIGQGVAIRIISQEGDPIEGALHLAKAEQADLLLASPRYTSIAGKAACPVFIMPGIILVPVDNSNSALAKTQNIIAEAKASGSKVMLLGVIPVHLYSSEEKKQLKQIRAVTAAMSKNMKKILTEQGLSVSEVMRSGYPDEEIQKAAEEYSVSLIMLPADGKTPSELTKAAAIILDEPERVRMPIMVLQRTGA